MILITEISFVCFIYAFALSKATRQCSSSCLDDKCDDTTGVCDACIDGRYGNYCIQDCTRCKDEQCDRSHCKNGCKSGYYQVYGQNYSDCFPCLPNCFSCQKSDECIQCNDGYFFQVDGDVHSCEKCRFNCANCSSTNDCISCKPGYYGRYCGQSCSVALPNCSLCNGNDAHNVICTQCSNGTALMGNKCETDISHTCPSICMSCSTDNVCESCKDGWYGSQCDNACSDEVVHCVACLETNGVVTCIACQEGYILSNDTCISKTAIPVVSSSIPIDLTTSITRSTVPTSTTTTVSDRKKQDDQAIPIHGQSQPCYENSITGDEIRLESANTESQRQENTELVNVRDDDQTYEYTRQTQTVVGSSADIEILSSPNGDQHDYTSLNIGQREHVYKDLTSV